jgi:hypothetical protein
VCGWFDTLDTQGPVHGAGRLRKAPARKAPTARPPPAPHTTKQAHTHAHTRAHTRKHTHAHTRTRMHARARAHLVEEDAPKVVPVGEHVCLAREVGAARVDQVQAGQAAGLGHLLQPQVLLRAVWCARAWGCRDFSAGGCVTTPASCSRVCGAAGTRAPARVCIALAPPSLMDLVHTDATRVTRPTLTVMG